MRVQHWINNQGLAPVRTNETTATAASYSLRKKMA